MFFVHVCLGMEDMGTWKLLKEILFAIAYNLMSVWHIVTLFSFMIAIIFAIGGLINIIF